MKMQTEVRAAVQRGKNDDWFSRLDEYRFVTAPIVGDIVILPDHKTGGYPQEYIVVRRIHQGMEVGEPRLYIKLERVEEQ